MEPLSRRDIIKGFEASRAKVFVYMAETLIERLGEDEGREAARDAVWEMSRDSGEDARKSYEDRGVENTWRNHRDENGLLYALAWDGGVVVDEPDVKVVEYSYCPLGDGFARLGARAEELGDIYCGVTDDAFWAGFNPAWTVTREKTFSRDGVCRLVWRRR
ncbi:L-2-amino-thiazoline-4-carboxylic acid hydrolase [Candidatus Bathyarchaeota archaeon]|nr:L-2-amino-thiazoline-4-carboxylic acid hydrolase [Candidatus Bathyarchaeota archaeon]